MRGHIDVVDGAAVEIDGVEAFGGAVNDFETDALLDGHIDQKRFVDEFGERLERHELVVRFGRPGVDLYAVLQSDDQKFDSLVFD